MDALCNERDAWIDNGSELTTQDFIEAKAQFEEHTAPIWEKINAASKSILNHIFRLPSNH